MQYEFHAADSAVFRYKELGDKMYLIIDGSVAVWVPRRTRDSILANAKMDFLNLKSQEAALLRAGTI